MLFVVGFIAVSSILEHTEIHFFKIIYIILRQYCNYVLRNAGL